MISLKWFGDSIPAGLIKPFETSANSESVEQADD